MTVAPWVTQRIGPGIWNEPGFFPKPHMKTLPPSGVEMRPLVALRLNVGPFVHGSVPADCAELMGTATASSAENASASRGRPRSASRVARLRIGLVQVVGALRRQRR